MSDASGRSIRITSSDAYQCPSLSRPQRDGRTARLWRFVNGPASARPVLFFSLYLFLQWKIFYINFWIFLGDNSPLCPNYEIILLSREERMSLSSCGRFVKGLIIVEKYFLPIKLMKDAQLCPLPSNTLIASHLKISSISYVNHFCCYGSYQVIIT